MSVVALTLSGCGGAVPHDGARVGGSFNSAVRASAWSRACDHLAPGTKAELEESAGPGSQARLGGTVRRFVRENSLSPVFGLLFLGALVGHACTGWAAFNRDQLADGLGRLTLGQYLTSASFAVDVTEI